MKTTLPPNGGLLNREWPYVNAVSTDIRMTFERVRNEQRNEMLLLAEMRGLTVVPTGDEHLKNSLGPLQ